MSKMSHGIFWDILGCPTHGDSVWSQSPRFKMSHGISRDIPEYPHCMWRHCKVPESQVQDVLWDILENPEMSNLWKHCKVPESQIQDVPWAILGHLGMSNLWKQCKVPKSQVQHVPWDSPRTSQASPLWRQCKVPESQVQDGLRYLVTSSIACSNRESVVHVTHV